jgi:hypothetical protein
MNNSRVLRRDIAYCITSLVFANALFPSDLTDPYQYLHNINKKDVEVVKNGAICCRNEGFKHPHQR